MKRSTFSRETAGTRRHHALGRAHMARVKELPCACCGRFGPSHAHHINSFTMGAKSSDFEVIPLCDLHHDGGVPEESVHAGLKIWKWSEPILLANTWAKLIEMGVIPPGTPVGHAYEAKRRSIF